MLVPPPVELEGVVQNLLVRPLTTHVLRQVPLISLMRLHCERSFALTQKHALESLQSKSRSRDVRLIPEHRGLWLGFSPFLGMQTQDAFREHLLKVFGT